MTSSPVKPIRISIVEDDEPARRILGNVVRSDPSLLLISDFGESAKAVATLPGDAPDVILMDINLPQMSGVECVQCLKPLMPQTQFLMLTVYDDPEHIFKALAAGATGYLLKSTRREDLIAAIQQIHEGGSPMSSAIARKVVRSFSGTRSPQPRQETEELSAREQQVIDLLAQGFLYKEIADKLSLNVFTVKTYTRRIYEKLHVHSRSQAAAKYYQKRG
jgi:DNA-binding NarL/FixJ family response regulator